MGNNLQALNTARSISKQLVANKQHLPKTNDRQNEVNLPRKRANSDTTGSEYGVTRYTNLAAIGSGYSKETVNGFSAINGSREHLGLARSVDNTSSDWNDNSFVYYSTGKSNKGPQETRPKDYSPEAKREKRTAIEQTTKSMDKQPVVVDLTLDDSDDDDDGGAGSGSGGDSSKIGGSKSSAVGGTSVGGGNIGVVDDRKAGVSRKVVANEVGKTVGGDGRSGISSVQEVSNASSNTGVGKGVVGDGSKAVSGVHGRGGGVGRVSVSEGVVVGDGSKVVSGVDGRGGGVGRVGVRKGIVSSGCMKTVSGVDDRCRVGVSDGSRVVGGAGSGVIIIGDDSSKVGVSSKGREVAISGGDGGKVGDDAPSRDHPSTLPKILAAYSLTSRCPPSQDICYALSQKAKENLVKQNGIVANDSTTPLPKGPNPDITELPLKNGIIPQPRNYVINNNYQSLAEPFACNRNDVMNDVTNLPNGDISSKKQMGFTNWSVKHDSNLDPVRRDQGGAVSPTEAEDQVIITKVVTSAEKSCGRKQHPRKAPVEVRKLFLEEKSRVEETLSTTSERDERKRHRKSKCVNKNAERHEKRTLEETIASLNGNIHGTPWSFSMKPDISYRENKIQSLKDRLAQQEEAIEKLRTKEKRVSSSRPNSANRVLVVQIPDLKTKLGIQSEKKQTFRVIDQIDSLGNLGSNKRKRKTLPRKVSREDRYDSDDSSDKSYRPQKRTRTRAENKQRLPRRPRGRSYSPVVRKVDPIVPVVSKDLWHREMEKVEAQIASENRPLDQTEFLLFLGLKKV